MLKIFENQSNNEQHSNQTNILGSVKNVCCHGAGEYLEIECKKRELLVPFNFDHILEISLEKKQIFLNRDYYEV